jgi:hypothetical protein
MRGMFVLYGLLGLAGRFLYTRLPERKMPANTAPSAALGSSRAIVIRLAALFSLDAFAGGFVVQSLLALWLFQRFHLSLTAAGVFFFCASLLAALSYPVAARLSRRFGLINTMVFTHIPSSIALILAALAPTLGLALAFLLIRAALSQMDVPTRSSYVMAVVTEAERPAAASFTSVPRSLASAASPAMAGALFAASAFAWPLLICGTLKIVYDLLLLAQFEHLSPSGEPDAGAPCDLCRRSRGDSNLPRGSGDGQSTPDQPDEIRRRIGNVQRRRELRSFHFTRSDFLVADQEIPPGVEDKRNHQEMFQWMDAARCRTGSGTDQARPIGRH